MAMTTAEKLEKINADPILWLKNFVRIMDNSGKFVPFAVNESQKEFLERKQRYNLVAKSRQLGMSTLMLGLFLYMALTKPRTNYLVVSYKLESSTILFERLKMMNDSLPRSKFKFPAIKHSNRDKLSFENGSTITLSVAGNKDVGRGGTFNGIHLSEMSFFSNQEKLLLSAEQALAKSEDSILTIESTSNGFNYYQQLCTKAERGQSKYKLFFFPFYSKATSKQFKIEIDEAVAWYKAQMGGVALREKDLTPEERALFEAGATLRLLMWRQFKRLDMSERDFNQEFPSTLQESFISTGLNVFEQQKISERLRYLPAPYSFKGARTCVNEFLLSLIGSGLSIYDTPKAGARYYGGADVASGSGGGDSSTIAIYDETGRQVAVFKSNKVAVYTFAKILNELGRFYNYAFLTVERNSFGTPVLERLRKEYGYMNLYKQKIFNQQTGKRKMQLGWSTTASNKAILLSDFKEAFELDEILINDRDTLEEMQIFVETNGKMGNVKGNGNHDDLVIASALAVQSKKASKWYV